MGCRPQSQTYITKNPNKPKRNLHNSVGTPALKKNHNMSHLLKLLMVLLLYCQYLAFTSHLVKRHFRNMQYLLTESKDIHQGKDVY